MFTILTILSDAFEIYYYIKNKSPKFLSFTLLGRTGYSRKDWLFLIFLSGGVRRGRTICFDVSVLHWRNSGPVWQRQVSKMVSYVKEQTVFAFKRDLHMILSCSIMQFTGTILFFRDNPLRNFVMNFIWYVSFWTLLKCFLHLLHGFFCSCRCQQLWEYLAQKQFLQTSYQICSQTLVMHVLFCMSETKFHS